MKLAIIIILSLLLIGCTTIEDKAKIAQHDFSGVCKQKNMEFVTTKLIDKNTVEIHCFTKSPAATYSFTRDLS